MIKISTKTRYAFRALLEIACRNDRKYFSLGELSRHQNISRKYLENIFGVLRKKGIVSSRIGKNGGFYLSEDIESISILRILEALEGEIDIVNCKTNRRICDRIMFCPAKGIWQELNATIKKTLASKNLKDLSRKKEIQEKCFYVLSRGERKPKSSRRRG